MLLTLAAAVYLPLLLQFPSFSKGEEDIDKLLEDFDREAKPKITKHLVLVQALVQNFIDATKNEVVGSDLHEWMAENFKRLATLSLTTEQQKRAVRNIRAKTIMLQGHEWKQLRNESLNMLKIYTGKVCAKRGTTGCEEHLPLYPTLRRIFANSTDKEVLLRYWKQWYHVNISHTPVLSAFERMVKLYHNGSVSMNYTDIANRTEVQYASTVLPDFKLEAWANESFYKLLPLYEELHAYVRHLLYGEANSATIEAHLVGDLFAESWQNIYLIGRKDGTTVNLDYSGKLKEKCKNQSDMLQMCKKFFENIGFKMEAICNGEGDCELRKNKDERICRLTSLVPPEKDNPLWMSMCAEVEMDDLNDMFTLMGRLVYANSYREQPFYFQDSANPGMLDSLGKAVALAFNSPSNLKELGLLDVELGDEKLEFEHLYKQALITIPSMMHAFAVDRWLRSFLRAVPPTAHFNWTSLNENWWQTLKNLTGISRPTFEPDYRSIDFLQVPRVAILEPVGREFFSSAFSYQLFEHFCNSTNPTEGNGLHQCYVGKQIENALTLGSSKDWAGTEIGLGWLGIEPLLRYFRPLYEKLKEENNDRKLCRGWGADGLWSEEVMSTLSPSRCMSNPPTTTEKPKDDNRTTTAKSTPATTPSCDTSPVTTTTTPVTTTTAPVTTTTAPVTTPTNGTTRASSKAASILQVPHCILCTLSGMALFLCTWSKFLASFS